MHPICVMLALWAMATDVAAQEAVPPPPPSPSAPVVVEPPPPPSLHLARTPVSPSTVARWHHARLLEGFGTAFGLIGSALSLTSAIYIVATDYPPSANDFLHPAKPTDTAQILSYAASSTSALGFSLSAGGLAWQHRILDELGADPGRGLFVSGTAVGLLGLVGVGAGYFFGLTDYLNPHDQSIASLTTSLGGALLCTVGSLLYGADSARMKRVFTRLTTF